MAREIIDQEIVNQMRAYAAAIIPAVEDEDADRIANVYQALRETFNVDGPHAVAVILADQIRVERQRWRERLLNAQSETLRFQEAYLDERRRVRELRALLDRTAASMPPKKPRKEGA